jgi:hypothetical protein
METILALDGAMKALGFLLGFGPIGALFLVWYFDRVQVNKILTQYREEALEQRRMYEANVELVKRYGELAGDLKDVITLNTTAMTRLVDRIDREVCK